MCRPEETLQSLYPKTFPSEWGTTKEEFDKLTRCSPDTLFSILHPNSSSPDWFTFFSQRLVPSKRLLDILHILAQPGRIVEYSLLSYASTKRKCWALSGELQDISIEELDVDRSIVDLLSDKKQLDNELRMLESKNFIRHSDGKIHLRHDFAVGWKQWKQAIPLVCFYFTGCEYSQDFSAIGNSALLLFQEMIKEFTQQDKAERLPHRKVILPALVQASKFSDLCWKRKCIDIMEHEGVEDLGVFTQAYFCVRKAFVLRSEGEWAASLEILRQRLALLGDKDLDPRLNAVRGLLLHSLATSLYEREKFDEASSVWREWNTGGTGGSLYETRVSIKLLTGTGKSMLHQGDFANAEKSLECALRQYVDGSRLRLDVLATLSDVYCEMGNPSEALSVLRSNGIPQVSSHDRYYTDCYISYAQALICTHQAAEAAEAEPILLELKGRFESGSHLDRYDRRRYIRVVLLLAQNLHYRAETSLHWKEAVERWKIVIESINVFDEVSCRDRGMIFLSMHHAVLQSGDTNDDWLVRGTSELKRKGRFWMRGMTTYWREFLLPKLPRNEWMLHSDGGQS